jgi:hypothetical protein
MKKRLPKRSLAAITGQCHLMGLTSPKKAWTTADRARLRHLFPTVTKAELLEAFPGRTFVSIQVYAYQMGLRRPRQHYLKTSHPVVALRRKKHDFRAVDRAVRALGGKLVVDWKADD